MPTQPPRSGPPKPREIARARRKRRERRQLAAALVVLLVAAGLGGFYLMRDGPPSAPRPRTDVRRDTFAGIPANITSATPGAGTWSYAADTGAAVGRGGRLRRYRVAVENGTGQGADRFAAAVDAVLGDAR